jgi:hypothetical protein
MELYSLTIYLGQRHRLFKVRFLSLHSTSPFKYLFSPRLKKVLESGREDRKYTSTHYRWAHDGQYDQRKVVKALICLVPAKSFFVPMRRKLSYNLPTMALLQAHKSLPPCHCFNPIGTASNNAIVLSSDEAVPSVSRPSQRPVSRYI